MDKDDRNFGTLEDVFGSNILSKIKIDYRKFFKPGEEVKTICFKCKEIKTLKRKEISDNRICYKCWEKRFFVLDGGKK
ncbi:MAG: hypothetical protein ACOCT9_01555 [archaeon]